MRSPVGSVRGTILYPPCGRKTPEWGWLVVWGGMGRTGWSAASWGDSMRREAARLHVVVSVHPSERKKVRHLRTRGVGGAGVGGWRGGSETDGEPGPGGGGVAVAGERAMPAIGRGQS